MTKIFAIVGSSPLTQLMIRRPLKACFSDLEVDYYSSSADLIGAMQSGRDFCVVFIDDVEEKGFDPLDCTRQVHNLDPYTIIIGQSANPNMKKDFSDNGAKYFILKTRSSSAKDVCDVVENVLRTVIK